MNSTTLSSYGSAFGIAAATGTDAASLTWNNNVTFWACPLDDSDVNFNVFTQSINDACEAIVLQVQGVDEDDGSCPTVTASAESATVSSRSKTTITLTVPLSRMSGSATGTSSAVATYRPDSAAAESVVPAIGRWMVVALMSAFGAAALGL